MMGKGGRTEKQHGALPNSAEIKDFLEYQSN